MYHRDSFKRTTATEVKTALIGSFSKGVFERRKSTASVVCYTAVFSVVTQRLKWGGALREDTKTAVYQTTASEVFFILKHLDATKLYF